MKPTQIINHFQTSRDRGEAVIDGQQALKHAIRFEAEIIQIVTCDINGLKKLLNSLAPDISQMVLNNAVEVDYASFTKLSPSNHRTKVVSLAKTKAYDLSNIDPKKPIVFLENPKDLQNIGAVIRVAAAADAGAVITDSKTSIWHPGVIRGAAGLQYALPVINTSLERLQDSQPTRKLISLDPTGIEIALAKTPKNAIFIFGSERSGVTKSTLASSDEVIRLKMQPGVSSLNLATSVAATLYQVQPVIT